MAHQEKWGTTALQVILDPTDPNPWVCSREVRFINLRYKAQENDLLVVEEIYGDQPVIIEWTSDGFIHATNIDSKSPTIYTIPISKCVFADVSKVFLSFSYSNAVVSAEYHQLPS